MMDKEDIPTENFSVAPRNTGDSSIERAKEENNFQPDRGGGGFEHDKWE